MQNCCRALGVPLRAEGVGVAVAVGGHSSLTQLDPSPTLPTQVGLARLAQASRDPGKPGARGEEQTESVAHAVSI